MKTTLFVVVSMFFTVISLSAQNVSEIRCSFASHHLEGGEQEMMFEEWIGRKKIENNNFIREGEGDISIRIPVVFHIMHNGEDIGVGANLSKEQIDAQIEQVNNDLRKTEGTSGYNNYEFGADLEIELAAALYDQDGYRLAEPGINRISNIEMEFGTGAQSEAIINAVVKPLTQWNPNEYLNVWITHLSSGVLGFAQFPVASGLDGIVLEGLAETDGVVLNCKSVGSIGMPNALATSEIYENYNKGRTFTHELGHWLGLRHTWGEGGCETDDYCLDTPYAEGANYGCTNQSYSCGSSDLTDNYMDYTDDICMNNFTQNQKERIMVVMDNSPRRVELLHSEKATPSPYTNISFFDTRIEKWSGVINWVTTYENNNSHFIIYKSVDGETYTQLSVIQGAGFSDELSSYECIHENPHKGTNYYKLVQVNYNGEESKEGIRMLEYYLGFEMEIRPNPTRGDLDINILAEEDGIATMKIFDMNGKEALSVEPILEIGQNQLDLDLDELSKGIYIIQVVQGRWQRHLKLQKI
jgi:hypothetical protein